MQGLAFLIPLVGVVAACVALGVSRASYYRAPRRFHFPIFGALYRSGSGSRSEGGAVDPVTRHLVIVNARVPEAHSSAARRRCTSAFARV